MSLFRKKRLLSSKEGTEALLACARVSMKESDVSKLSVNAEATEAFNALVASTNEAIVAYLLRRTAQGTHPDSREYEFVDSFEKLAILNIVFDPADARFARFTDLMIRVEQLDEIMRSVDEPTLRRAIPEWSRGWLGTIWTDEDTIERTALVFGGHICIYVHQQIVSLAETIKSALYEKR
jgi:hypothetical protein